MKVDVTFSRVTNTAFRIGVTRNAGFKKIHHAKNRRVTTLQRYNGGAL